MPTETRIIPRISVDAKADDFLVLLARYPGRVLTHRVITTFAAQAEGIDAKKIVGRLVEETAADEA